MSNCSYCGRNIDGLPHKCRYCSKVHCSDHLLPEDHECSVLEKYKKKNLERWKKVFTSRNKKSKIFVGKKLIQKNTSENNKTRNYFHEKYSDFIYWLKKKGYHEYDYRRTNYLTKIILIFVASIVAFSIFYSNVHKFNNINLWFIKIGGVLILISLFFVIKYSLKTVKEFINIIKRQRNWLKYLVIILIIVLLWYSYNNRDTVLNPLFEIYNETNFSLFAPINFGGFSSNSTNNENSDFGSFIQGVLDPKTKINISELEQRVHYLINIERTSNGLKALSFDEKLANIARAHSEDMAKNNYLAHINLKGQDPTDRANIARYNCHKELGGGWYSEGIAENIAETPIYSDVIGCDSTTNLDGLAECIVGGWMNSPGHRENILTTTFDREGIGIAYSEDNKAYSTENFC